MNCYPDGMSRLDLQHVGELDWDDDEHRDDEPNDEIRVTRGIQGNRIVWVMIDGEERGIVLDDLEVAWLVEELTG